jgi:hypothetical protein
VAQVIAVGRRDPPEVHTFFGGTGTLPPVVVAMMASSS